ncbi:MAG: DUF2238 domain-containing protein [Firmicutes bacterium]|nr:DUF2238 domain-containing protein [Bacillota bacterium]
MKKLNRLIILVMLILNTLFLTLTVLGKFDSNILVSLSLYIIVFLPTIIKKIFKIKIIDLAELLFLIFIFLAQLLGSVMHFYGIISWYDSFVHFISGILSALLAIYLLVLFNKYNKKSIAFNILFMFSISLMIAAGWEIFEFTADSLLGGNAQRALETGVRDTMKDIICAFMGSILIVIPYIYKLSENND